MGKSSLLQNSQEPDEARNYSVIDQESAMNMPGMTQALQSLQRLVGLDDETFINTYRPLIINYMQFVQHLAPPHQTQQVAKSSWFHWRFTRSARALMGFVHQVEQTQGEIFDSAAWQRTFFAVFSASLLFEIGRACQHRQVHLTDKSGVFQARWLPQSGAISQQGSYYKVRYAASLPDALVQPLTVQYATQVLGAIGVAWLTEDPVLLSAWFKALVFEEELFGVFRIDYEIERYAHFLSHYEMEEAIYEFPEETLEGERYWAWLKEEIKREEAQEKLDEQERLAYEVEEGQLVRQNVAVSRYLKSYGRQVMAGVLVAQFNHLGIAQLSGQDFAYSAWFGRQVHQAAPAAGGLFDGAPQQQIKAGSVSQQQNIEGVVLDRHLAKPTATKSAVAMPQSAYALVKVPSNTGKQVTLVGHLLRLFPILGAVVANEATNSRGI